VPQQTTQAAGPPPPADAPIALVLSGPAVPQPALGAGRAVLGKVVTTEWGQIQVQLTIEQGRVTSARAVRIPEVGGRTGEGINTRAIPVLDTRSVAAQSAKIDAVSGATVSSDGYRTSLQSAIDAAHL
jgi:FMN-binding domain